MKILFLDQSGQVGGAELCLLDVARSYRDQCLVCLFSEGSFRERLEREQIQVRVLSTPLHIKKDSGVFKGFISIRQVMPLILKVSRLSYEFDLIYANTQKALVVGAIASTLSRRPLVYHLHDIVSTEHFSAVNQGLIIYLANRYAAGVIANSQATKTAFHQAGGQSPTEVIYNGFDITAFGNVRCDRLALRQQLGLDSQFVVGHFSRLSPWKGQHILIQALKHCPEDVVALFVGDALFGEQEYVQQLHRQIEQEGLHHRVRFLGFRSDVPQLMAACDAVTHTSTAPEPFGRVIVEAMLCGTPVIAAAAGGAVELITPGQTGWLTTPGHAQELATAIHQCYQSSDLRQAIATTAQLEARQRFSLTSTNQQISQFLHTINSQLSSRQTASEAGVKDGIRKVCKPH